MNSGEGMFFQESPLQAGFPPGAGTIHAQGKNRFPILFTDKNVKRFGTDFSFWLSQVEGGVVGPKRSENVPVAHF